LKKKIKSLYYSDKNQRQMKTNGVGDKLPGDDKGDAMMLGIVEGVAVGDVGEGVDPPTAGAKKGMDGISVGAKVGENVGMAEGESVNVVVGALEEGTAEGATVNEGVGTFVTSALVGSSVGELVGMEEGVVVGPLLGPLVEGLEEGMSVSPVSEG
jgi:hypothetical protein